MPFRRALAVAGADCLAPDCRGATPTVKLALACDHAGYRLKTYLLQHLRAQGWDCQDLGAYDESPCDYPDLAFAAAQAVAAGTYERGILICGTGIGSAICANKVKGIRAAVCHDPVSARLAREHNDANILCLGGRILGEALALGVAQAFLTGRFTGEERHSRRIRKITSYEEQRR